MTPKLVVVVLVAISGSLPVLYYDIPARYVKLYQKASFLPEKTTGPERRPHFARASGPPAALARF